MGLCVVVVVGCGGRWAGVDNLIYVDGRTSVDGRTIAGIGLPGFVVVAVVDRSAVAAIVPVPSLPPPLTSSVAAPLADCNCDCNIGSSSFLFSATTSLGLLLSVSLTVASVRIVPFSVLPLHGNEPGTTPLSPPVVVIVAKLPRWCFSASFVVVVVGGLSSSSVPLSAFACVFVVESPGTAVPKT